MDMTRNLSNKLFFLNKKNQPLSPVGVEANSTRAPYEKQKIAQQVPTFHAQPKTA